MSLLAIYVIIIYFCRMNSAPKKSLRERITPAKIRLAFDFLIVTVLVVFALIWAWKQFMDTPPFVNHDRYPIKGIDVSAHNGHIDWQMVKQGGVEFAFLKATEGIEFRDSMFTINYREARKSGIKVGAYHFFRFGANGVDQAMNLLQAIENKPLDLGIAIDVEKNGNSSFNDYEVILDQLHAMVDYLNLRGYRVLFYSNKDGYYDFIARDFKGIPLWICSFTSNPINTEWQYWQYNHHGRVKGITGDVDLNVYVGDRDDWNKFLSRSNETIVDSLSIN